MSRSHILTPFWTSGATATSNSEASPAVPASNLLTVLHSRKWRSAGVSSLQITLDAGSAKPFDTVYLGYTNAVASDTITITANASTGALFTSPSFSYGPVSIPFAGDLSPFTEHDCWVPVGSTQTYRYIGIEIDASSNPDGYFQAGVVLAGEDFEPDIGADLGWRVGFDDPSPGQRLLSGEIVVRGKRSYGVWSGTFPKQGNTDAMRWMAINRVYGSQIPVVAKWDPYTVGFEQYFIIFGHLKWRSGGAITYVHGDPLWDVEVEIEEV